MSKKKDNSEQKHPAKETGPRQSPLAFDEQKKREQNLNAELSTNTESQTNNYEANMSRWTRFKNWARKDSTFADWCIVAFTGVLAGSAIYQFMIMRGQLDQLQNTNRPYIFTTRVFSFTQMPTVDTLREIPVTVHLLNVGVSPALHVRHSEPIVGLETDTDVTEHAKNCSFTYPETDGFPLPPNQASGETTHTVTRTLSEDERKDVVVTKTKHLIVMGGVKYAGVRGGDYETIYCYIWDPEWLKGHTYPWQNCPCTKMQ